ncbi:13748_t:CDS:2, partial [Cetraspora pellucida]
NVTDVTDHQNSSKTSTSMISSTLFTDLTNYNMLFHQQYPTLSFFMNPLALNKATIINQENSSLKNKLEISEPVSDDDLISDTNSVSSKTLQKAKDQREKDHIWNKIILEIQSSNSNLKMHSKTSIQQKWESIYQKYQNIKDVIKNTDEEAIQNEWEFFDNIDIYMKNFQVLFHLLLVIQFMELNVLNLIMQ